MFEQCLIRWPKLHNGIIYSGRFWCTRMTDQEIFLMLLYAISAATRSESTVVLREEHLQMRHVPSAKRSKPLPPKNVRKWRGLYEHRDTPIHHH